MVDSRRKPRQGIIFHEPTKYNNLFIYELSIVYLQYLYYHLSLA